MTSNEATEASRIIDAIGGTGVTASLCEVSEAAVSQWRKEGIPNARLMFLRLAKPDVFAPQLETHAGPP